MASSLVHPRAATRAYAFDTDGRDLPSAVEVARRLGFERLMALGAAASDPACEAVSRRDVLSEAVGSACQAGLAVDVWLRLDRIAAGHPLVRHYAPSAFSRTPDRDAVLDPRRPLEDDAGLAVLARGEDDALFAWWRARLGELEALGAGGFGCLDRGRAAQALAERLRRSGFAITVYVLFDTEAPLVQGAPGFVGEPRTATLDPSCKRKLLAEAVTAAPGWAMRAGFEGGVEAEVSAVNVRLKGRAAAAPLVRTVTALGGGLEVVVGEGAPGACAFARNRSDVPQPWPPAWLEIDADLIPVGGFGPVEGVIEPGETALFDLRPRKAVASVSPESATQAAEPTARVIIAEIDPLIDGGAFPIKRVPGEPLEVRARIFADGHLKLSATLLTKADDETNWTRVPFTAEPNDLVVATTSFARVGRHAFRLEAWVDEWGGFLADLAKKRTAGVDVALELREGRAMVERARARGRGQLALRLGQALRAVDKASPAEQADALASSDLAAAMAEADERRFLATSPLQPVVVDRIAARFSSWYELFPRSQGRDPALHGTFADVVARLPRIAAMGFDTVYFPPIHPIGETNRKGRNNARTAGPGDLGSPYAIGSAAGGHDAIHPDLGTLEDFHALVAVARGHGLEIALDFAIQCSPDHPWVKAHPEWFDWRPDGSLKFAENPPKKYEDIVNVDFYRDGAVPALWEALREVVLFWADQGVWTFRVDNPHTKPFAFWRWMIAEAKARRPELIFLSEAFTRPGPMLRLAKVGFTQSYGYFTWRNTKAELTEYFTELNTSPWREVLRPHLFVNTPDINPFFLQTSGRAGFLIRAALAATLSGLFGVYAGFEFCESAPLPGREEYLDSEKYEIRARPDRAPGDIVDEIAQLNAIRRAEPALQTHLGLEFHNAFDDQVLYFSKRAPGADSLVLVAVSLDPRHPREADFEVPLWLFGLPDHGTVWAQDLLTGRRMRWTGKVRRLRLTPEEPYAIWRIAPLESA